MANSLYREISSQLKSAGYELVRKGKHTIWKSKDHRKGVVVSHNIRDKNLAKSLLREVGIKFVLASILAIPVSKADPPPKTSADGQIMAPYGQSIRGLTQPGNTAGCCDLSDCRPVDVITKGNHYEAFIRHLEPDGSGWQDGPDKLLEAPDSVIIRRTDIPFPVACWASYHKENNGFYCLTLGSGT